MCGAKEEVSKSKIVLSNNTNVDLSVKEHHKHKQSNKIKKKRGNNTPVFVCPIQTNLSDQQ